MNVTRALLIALVLGIAGCGSSSSSPSKPYTNTDGYPLDVCVVSGEKLGAMGDPYVIKHDGKTVKLCCSSCLKEFNKDTAKYMSILDDAEKQKTPAK